MKNALSTVKEYQNVVNTLLYVYISYYICVPLKVENSSHPGLVLSTPIINLIGNKFVSIVFDFILSKAVIEMNVII